MPTTDKQKAANRANAAKSTGPRTREGKIRSSQNARKYTFTPASFAVVRIENPELVENLRADAIATYQPASSQELFAVERIALAQLSMLRLSAMEAGLFSNYLDEAPDKGMNSPEQPVPSDGQWAADGFRRVAQQSNVIAIFLRYQAQAERLYRRAVEDFNRLRKHYPEPVEETSNEPIPGPQPVATKTRPQTAVPKLKIEPKPVPVPNAAPRSGNHLRPLPVAKSAVPSEGNRAGF